MNMQIQSNGQEIVDEIFSHYYNTYNGEFRHHLGASMGGDPCMRKLWYSFRWAKIILHPGRIQKLFQRGHKEEPTFANELNAVGINVLTEDQNGKQFRLTCPDNYHIGGSCDGFGEVKSTRFTCLVAGEWVVVEMKTHSEKSYKKLQKEGVRKSKPLHYSQMNLYMKWANLPKALYIAVNKNTDELYVEIVDFDQVEADRVEQNMIFVVNADEAPPRLHEDPSQFDCKYCDQSDICHTEKYKLEVNCRTCVYSKAQPNGTWVCQKYGSEVQDQRGCSEHIFKPSLLENVATACDYKENEWVEFEFLHGHKIKNGKKDNAAGVYSSAQLAAIIQKGYQAYDGTLKQLEKAFDAEVVA